MSLDCFAIVLIAMVVVGSWGFVVGSVRARDENDSYSL